MKRLWVLQLDYAWLPERRISWQRAITLLFNERAEVLEHYENEFVSSPSTTLQVPCVVRIKLPAQKNKRRKKITFSKNLVFAREKGRCAYCGVLVSKHNKTIDHVIPSSRGGKTTFKNCVLCCKKCNDLKGDKTPEEAGMSLRHLPYEPNVLDYRFLPFYDRDGMVPKQWQKYLF